MTQFRAIFLFFSARLYLPMLLQFNKCWFIWWCRRYRTAVHQIFWLWRIHNARVRCTGRALVGAPQICEVKRVGADWCHFIEIYSRRLRQELYSDRFPYSTNFFVFRSFFGVLMFSDLSEVFIIFFFFSFAVLTCAQKFRFRISQSLVVPNEEIYDQTLFWFTMSARSQETEYAARTQ